MKKVITIAHIHVWDHKNKGDVGIILSIQELFKKYWQTVKILNFPLETLKEYNFKNIEKINKAQILVIGGGGIFYRYFMPFNKKLIDAIKIPIIIFSAGYIREVGAESMSEYDMESIAYLNNKATLVAVRDYYTKNFLARNGVPKSKIQLIGDTAILLSEKAPQKFQLKKGINIGLNLNYSGWLGFGKWSNDILNAYNNTAHYFIKNFNANIYYLKHHPDEDKILTKLNFPFTIIDFNPHEQKYLYGQLDLVIGMMLHSCVMSFGAGTPEINVAYDIRNKNFARFIGCPELFVPLEKLNIGLLEKKSADVFTRRFEYRKKFQRKISQIKKKHEYYLEQIKKLLV